MVNRMITSNKVSRDSGRIVAGGVDTGVPNETAPQENRSTVFNQSGWEIRKPGVELAGKIRNEINPLLGV